MPLTILLLHISIFKTNVCLTLSQSLTFKQGKQAKLKDGPNIVTYFIRLTLKSCQIVALTQGLKSKQN